MAELEKALLKAPRPSVFFETLGQMEQLGVWFPEVQALIGVPQEPKFHPEGDVWNHTVLVLDRAAALRAQAEHPRELMFAALCHDFGKPDTTRRDDTGRIALSATRRRVWPRRKPSWPASPGRSSSGAMC